jgi:protease-4
MRAWEIALAALFLALCLIGGLYLDRSTGLRQLAGGGASIGLVRFEGEIDFESANEIITLLEAARQNDSVSAVVLELYSPGGYATSSESIYYTLLRLRAEKPLVVVIDGLAASGGYYMAATANRILAPASAYVGNVGTRGGRPADPSLAPDELSSGPYKLEGGSRFDQIQQLDLVAQAFLQNVATQRAASPTNPLKLSLAELGEARLYLGSEALALGLIDGEGGRTDGILAAAELAGLSDYQVVDLPAYLGLLPPPAEDTPGANAAARHAASSIVAQGGIQDMVAQAPPGTIYMLDSRIALPAAALSPALAGLPAKRTGDAVLGARHAPSSTWAGSLLRSTPDWNTAP